MKKGHNFNETFFNLTHKKQTYIFEEFFTEYQKDLK